MKLVIACAAALMIMCSCGTPGPITGNPDKSTSTPGTVGSAQMTNQVPNKQTVETRRDQDSAARRRESEPARKP